MAMKPAQLSLIVNMDDPQSVLKEVRAVVTMMFTEFDFDLLDRVFRDVVLLFQGGYPGYRKCNTEYHDLKHTTDTFLAMARLIHGYLLSGENLSQEYVNLGLICALMHDTGYVQTVDDKTGTGAKYTLADTKRSILFMKKYIARNGLPKKKFRNFADVLRGTGLDTKISEIEFQSREVELLSKMLGTADLMGQMADRIYLEKLLFLFYEFREGAVRGYKTELDLLKKTIGFYEMTQQRFATELDGVNEYMHGHFKVRWNLDRDLYREAIEKNIAYLKLILETHLKDYRDHLRRGGIVKRLRESPPTS
jgi:hypothetical protein